MADLESTADEVVQLESRAEAAENERDEAVGQLRVSTPRPRENWDALMDLVGEQGGAGRVACMGVGGGQGMRGEMRMQCCAGAV